MVSQASASEVPVEEEENGSLHAESVASDQDGTTAVGGGFLPTFCHRVVG